jgi:hypothetical protein
MHNKTFQATAIWLRRIGDKVQMLAEIDGKWRLAAEECFDGPFSHIAEGNGSDGWQLDPVTSGSELLKK